MTLIIPALPSESYCAEGEEIQSIFSMLFAGNWFKKAIGSDWIGFPLSITTKPLVPRMVIVPNASIAIPGRFFKISLAVPPCAA